MALVWAGVVASVFTILARLIMMVSSRGNGLQQFEQERPAAVTKERDGDER
jgi:hypothetical protein